MVKSRSSQRKKSESFKRASNSVVVINSQFSMKKLTCGKSNTADKFDKWLNDVFQAVSFLYPLHTFVTLNNEKYSYKKVIKRHKPKLPRDYPTLSQEKQIEAKSELDQLMKTHATFVRDLEKEKPAVFALVYSLLSKESKSRVKQHQSWSQACSHENNLYDPAILMNIIRVTHQNGMLAIDEDIKDVKREFKYMFYTTKQTKHESLFDWIERIIAFQERDKAICISDPDYDPSEPHVPIIEEEDYAALAIDKLNDEHSDVRADYINQKRLKNIQSFDTVQEAREFIDSYVRSRQLIDQREEAVSRSEFITLKSTLESVLNGKPEDAKVLLSKGGSSKKRKKSSSDAGSSGARKPTRPCKHCEKLKVSTDKMHWDNECPIAAYLAVNSKSTSDPSEKAERKDSKKKAGVKRKQGGKPKNDAYDHDDDKDASDDDESEDDFDDSSPKRYKRNE